MLHISLFSGIGGFDLASEWMGWKNIASCEINPFGKKVLEHYWPDAYHHDDIKTLTIEKINHELEKKYGKEWRSDDIVLSGGFPCQPYSTAGKRLGKNDDRHLWPEMFRIIREVRPKWIVGENVRGLISWNGGLVFDEVQSDLEAEGYEVQSFVLPAASINAPHRRDRVWIVAKNTMQCGCAHGKLKQEGAEVWQQRNTCTGDTDGICREALAGLTFNANNKRGCNGFAKIQKANGEVSERYYNAESCNTGDGLTSNAELSGLEGQNWRGMDGAIKSSKQAASNANSNERCEGRMHQAEREKTERHAGSRNARGDGWKTWENFPTQSPICGRNDGLPAGLDGITFSKWRNESIKAYGNAVVPQLVFRIFQAIEAYESKWQVK